MKKFKQFLKKWPRVYVGVQRAYYGLLYAGETRFLGSKIHEWVWTHRRKVSPVELIKAAAHPHRGFLVDKIAELAPFQSVLEIGCNAAPNLLLLAHKFPDVAFYGIDINPRFIEAGRNWLAREDLTNVSLAIGRADELSRFRNQSIDVTFTDATLMYIGPDKIGRTIQEMTRVTRKALIFNEWNLDNKHFPKQSFWHYFHWVHNYRSLLEEHVSGDKVCITRLPKGLWEQGGGWEEYGALIEVNL